MQGQKPDPSVEGCGGEPLLGPELFKTVANKDAFLARTAVNDPKQLQEFLRKAITTQQAGHFSLVEALSFCPTNWKTKGVETVKFLEEKMKPVFRTGVI